jgi:hypothetical protein
LNPAKEAKRAVEFADAAERRAKNEDDELS